MCADYHADDLQADQYWPGPMNTVLANKPRLAVPACCCRGNLAKQHSSRTFGLIDWYYKFGLNHMSWPLSWKLNGFLTFLGLKNINLHRKG